MGGKIWDLDIGGNTAYGRALWLDEKVRDYLT